ncbi:MAG: hypothetical protein FIB06_07720 [Betaproteobacteria bacterium]|nr:hypothetical protein [Betaproteobacteria bacterium]
MQALLSFDKAPPFAAPARFFLTAPLFLLAAALVLLASGPELLESRWSPALVAVTHLVTVGFMLMVMCGALIQILPVVAGANLAEPLGTARWLHAGLTGGALALAAALASGEQRFLAGAAGLLGAVVAGFLWAAGRPLFAVASTSPTIRGLKIALAGLAVATAAGCLIAVAVALGWPLPHALPDLVDLHAGWALGAWGGVLLAAMAYVVVPMFQLTPGYPARPGWLFPPLVLGLAVLWAVGAGFQMPFWVRVAQGATALAGIAFAALTLRLQSRRRRARADATLRCWQVALVATLLALLMLLASAVHPALGEHPRWAVLGGVLLIVGGYVSFITGMLYKIVPFLAWLHLQNCGAGVSSASRILADRPMLAQTRVHALAVFLLAAACLWPEWLARPAGFVLASASAWMFANLAGAMRRYRELAAAGGGR